MYTSEDFRRDIQNLKAKVEGKRSHSFFSEKKSKKSFQDVLFNLKAQDTKENKGNGKLLDAILAHTKVLMRKGK